MEINIETIQKIILNSIYLSLDIRRAPNIYTPGIFNIYLSILCQK